MSKRTISVLCFFFLAAGCAGLAKPKYQQSSALSLAAADGIQLGTEHQEEIIARLGNPSVALDIPARPLKALLYCEKEPCTEGHLTFHVDKESRVVKSVVWVPESGEPDNLEAILSHYKNVTFKKQRYLYNYGDYMYEAETYKNQDLGITIGYDPYHMKVTQVSRQDPKAPLIVVASRSKFPIITELQDRDTAAIHESSSK